MYSKQQPAEPMTLQQLFDFCTKQAAKMFNNTGSVVPMWHAVPATGDHMLIATPWNSAEDKDAVADILRQLFKREGVKCYAFMGEAWTAAITKIPEVHKWAGKIAQHPDRREILAIHAEDDKGNALMGWYYILRPEHGPAKLSPLQTSVATESTGRLMGLLQ
jgi:hypothetical protein